MLALDCGQALLYSHALGAAQRIRLRRDRWRNLIDVHGTGTRRGYFHTASDDPAFVSHRSILRSTRELSGLLAQLRRERCRARASAESLIFQRSPRSAISASAARQVAIGSATRAAAPRASKNALCTAPCIAALFAALPLERIKLNCARLRIRSDLDRGARPRERRLCPSGSHRSHADASAASCWRRRPVRAEKSAVRVPDQHRPRRHRPVDEPRRDAPRRTPTPATRRTAVGRRRTQQSGTASTNRDTLNDTSAIDAISFRTPSDATADSRTAQA